MISCHGLEHGQLVMDTERKRKKGQKGNKDSKEKCALSKKHYLTQQQKHKQRHIANRSKAKNDCYRQQQHYPSRLSRQGYLHKWTHKRKGTE
jgi:hypothetical protein